MDSSEYSIVSEKKNKRLLFVSQKPKTVTKLLFFNLYLEIIKRFTILEIHVFLCMFCLKQTQILCRSIYYLQKNVNSHQFYGKFHNICM